MKRFFAHIDTRIREILGERRMGFYLAVVSHALRSFRRVDVDAEWGPTLRRLRRISSPILDVIPPRGARMAVLSQDGVPEFGAIIGKIWDDEGPVEQMTAWLRANLEDHPGHIEMGAEEGIRIVVGDNAVDLEPTETGRVEIVASGDVVIDSGDVHLGSASADDAVSLSTLVEGELDSIWTAFNAHAHPSPTGGTTGTPVSPGEDAPGGDDSISGSAGEVGANKVTAE